MCLVDNSKIFFSPPVDYKRGVDMVNVSLAPVAQRRKGRGGVTGFVSPARHSGSRRELTDEAAGCGAARGLTFVET